MTTPSRPVQTGCTLPVVRRVPGEGDGRPVLTLIEGGRSGTAERSATERGRGRRWPHPAGSALDDDDDDGPEAG